MPNDQRDALLSTWATVLAKSVGWAAPTDFKERLLTRKIPSSGEAVPCGERIKGRVSKPPPTAI